jgi:ABC-2 type transport system permease protein
MKSFAEERKQKTDQLLYSLPLNTWQIVIGKYLALVILFLIPVAIISVYPFIFSKFGEVYLPSAYGSMAAFFIMGIALIAVGMFISTLTENQGFAAGIAIVLFLFNYYSVKLSEQVSSTALGSMITLIVIAAIIGFVVKALTKNNAISLGVGGVLIVIIVVTYLVASDKFEGLVPNIMESLSLFNHFTTFVNGVFDMTGIVFYASVIVAGLFLTAQSLEKRRYN